MEPESISVERLNGERASDYFAPHDPGSRTNDQYETIVEGVVDAGGVIAAELSYTSTLSVGWLNHHEAEIGSRTESTNHVALKLRLAKLLDELGHDCGRWSPQIEYEPELERWETKDYLYSGFETDYAANSRVADFSCSCPSHTIYAEAGRTPPKKLIDANLGDSADLLLTMPYGSVSGSRRDTPSEVSVAAFADSESGLSELVSSDQADEAFAKQMRERLATCSEEK